MSRVIVSLTSRLLSSMSRLRSSFTDAKKAFYVCNLSSKTLVYKGMLTASQIPPMFPDLADPDFVPGECDDLVRHRDEAHRDREQEVQEHGHQQAFLQDVEAVLVPSSEEPQERD